MTEPAVLLAQLAARDPSHCLAIAALLGDPDAGGATSFGAAAVTYREGYLAALRIAGTGRSEAGTLSMDAVRSHLAASVLPRLATDGFIEPSGTGWDDDTPVRLTADVWLALGADATRARAALTEAAAQGMITHGGQPQAPSGSRLEGVNLSKAYGGRVVVNEVSVHLSQGEIVGLLGPNGAGKTTTFYMLVGLIAPDEGQIVLDGRDISRLPMYQRARSGVGYLAQEPSIFRKLTVEENLMAILETMDLGRAERRQRLEALLDELSLKHLRKNRALALSGGERRRLEITRALCTEPKFMLLDEPFSGVDPIAVHDIQTIVAGLRRKGIGVLITDHNVEQTLDIVDRAYIMFEGRVQVAGSVRELVYDDRVAELYLGPTLAARLRSRLSPARVSMRPSLGQHTLLRQDLRINPRLYQAMDLLYMPLLDLQQHLKQELLENPFLELTETDSDEVSATDIAQEREKAAAAKETETNWEDILLEGFQHAGWREDSEAQEYREPVTVQRAGLADHLRDQLKLQILTDRQMLLAENIVGNIADDGYLAVDLEEVVRGANELLDEFAESRPEGAPKPEPFSRDEAEAVLRVIQLLDPAGVGARSLRECLLLQLRDEGHRDSLEFRLLEEAYDDFIAHRWSELGKRLGIDAAQVQAAADRVARLDPKPGLRYGSGGDDYIVPDLVVDKVDGEYRVFLNDRNLPRLRLSKSYQEVARDKKKFVGENREFITQRLNSAQWMIQAIEQRRQTMLKVMNFIVDRQREFFDKGIEYLRPLTLREVAEVISMHESTVSRVTNEKWVQTPRGVLPLKFFFSSALATTTGEDASARSIRAALEKLVHEESALEPLTDQQIVQKLREKGVRIARRTVAKYRDQLGILSARMRKRV